MGKKTKEEPVPTINSVQNRDIIQRLNYMYQAGAFLQNLQGPIPESGEASSSSSSAPATVTTVRRKIKAKNGKKSAKKIVREVGVFKTMGDLGRSYVRSMQVVGQRTTVKMDPSIKRTICKGCHVSLIPGATVSTRVEKLSSHGHVVVYTCFNCKTKRKIPAPPTANVPTIPSSSPSDVTQTLIEAPTSTATDASPTEHPHIQDIAMADPDLVIPQQRVLTRVLRKKKRAPIARQPILSERKDAGHVLFRGTEKLSEE
ncbi:hypothetical protein D9611_013262 [Ephemerocybe angulata]|uniref:Rpr2-domain-containing protein n=1 Tax=Ephemerocybe angulata TaxID=980116 RepID=A0A8H5FJ61_9AGAR|nr:hypothetical protein D9611_013262 [Tulosesus angulatus]